MTALLILSMTKYFLRVIGVFVVLGPLFPVFPGLGSFPFFIGAWFVGALPAFLAAIYYFVFTFWLDDAHLPSRPVYRFALFGLLGAGCGMLGILSYAHLPIPHSQFTQLFIASKIFSLSVGAIGGFGSAVFIVWLCRQTTEAAPTKQA